MSSTDNIIHLVLATCYNILNDAASKIDAEMHALTCTLSHIRSHYVGHNRERLHFSLEPL
jgi:hypothetical protein